MHRRQMNRCAWVAFLGLCVVGCGEGDGGGDLGADAAPVSDAAAAGVLACDFRLSNARCMEYPAGTTAEEAAMDCTIGVVIENRCPTEHAFAVCSIATAAGDVRLTTYYSEGVWVLDEEGARFDCESMAGTFTIL